MIYDKMLFLLRRCKFNAPQYRGHVARNVKSPKHCLSLFPNPNGDSSLSYCKLFSTETNLSVRNTSVQKYLNLLMDTYQNDAQNSENIAEILKIRMIPKLLNEKIKVIENMKMLNELVVNNKEMKDLAKEEEEIYQHQLLQIDEQILDTILNNLGKESFDNVMLEIIPGIGGQEAMLFAKDLFNMYIGYIDHLGLSHDVIEVDVSDQGGLRKATILVASNKAFEKFQYEGGIHRVQRVPATERAGRLHTSTASVAVLPEPKDIDVQLDEKDLKIETKRASGAGGQHVNTTDSAVRIVHLPTGTAVNCQSGKSQMQNKKWALMKLKSILYEQRADKQMTYISDLRKKQMGSRLRNEKIRTYNYNQDRITDHRIANGTMHNLKEFLKGGSDLEELEDRLHEEMQQKLLLDVIEKTESQLK